MRGCVIVFTLLCFGTGIGGHIAGVSGSVIGLGVVGVLILMRAAQVTKRRKAAQPHSGRKEVENE